MSEIPLVEDAVQVVLASLPCSVTLPAGAGKTELIAATAAKVAQQGGVSLVLTHTHAGVDVLRRRMSKFGVATDRVVVRTIDSWSFDLITHFPQLANLEAPTTPDWGMSSEYHRAAAQAARTKAVKKMLKVSYTNLFVDEYQDCLVDQHDLIVALSHTVQTAIFGDPLQSLFNFGVNQPVLWDSHVLPVFPAVAVKYRPRRWDPEHQALGKWLVEIRQDLLSARPIDFTTAPVNWVQRQHPRTFVDVSYQALRHGGSVAILGHFRGDCVAAARNLNGSFSVMEAIDGKIPTTLAETIDTQDGPTAAQAVVEFAIESSIGLAGHITSLKRKQLGENKSFRTTKEELQPAYEAVRQIRDTPTPASVHSALKLMGSLPNVIIHCREAWDEILRSLAMAANDGCSVNEALQITRNHTRRVGRKPTSHVVSRPLLVKGLEYDHVIILKPETYTAQELYVALTRGSKSVTVVSDARALPAAKIAGHRTSGV